ncbi:nitrogen fixation protein NifZ [Frankia sp. AgPm24]|uniref:nitrogen fixation protein NifZ n=1 Tax=Frankia sp. AgPm24 TaxID=631128 RepID=UPI0020100709|nr:nitrogen fixation protein NifZ [Frankia sp. AgPm24]MCK9920518.1 nitrogen fixation protein NifZ [Frankia sp. AgPm24]
MTSNVYNVGDVVCTVKDLRNDGTYPDPEVAIGEVIVEAGTIGEVINVGLYLQEHIVYAVAFRSGRIVGALERELAVPVDDDGAPLAAQASTPSTPPSRTPAEAGSAQPPAIIELATVQGTGHGDGHGAGHGGGHGDGHGGGCKHGSSNCRKDGDAVAVSAVTGFDEDQV